MANVITFDSETSRGIMSMPLFSTFYYDPKIHPWDQLKDFEIGDPIQMMVHVEDGAYRYIGSCVIEALKISTFRGLTNDDIKTCVPAFTSRLEIIKHYWEEYPEYKSDISADAQLGVVTLRPIIYDLKSLNSMVKKTSKVSGVR